MSARRAGAWRPLVAVGAPLLLGWGCSEAISQIDPARVAALRVEGSSDQHWTDFLTPGCRTHVYPGLSARRRAACLDALRTRGYTHFYLYAYNERDYGGPSFDFYDRPEALVAYLVELREEGLLPVVWLFPDDALAIAAESSAELMGRLDRLVPSIDPLVDSYVLGLELDEYWGPERVDSLGTHLRGLTERRIGVHQLPAQWDLAHFDWVDFMVLQYGFGRSVEEIRTLTLRAITELGKPVVAGEYELDEEAKALPLGDAGVRSGAAGFGNGGTVPPGVSPPG